MKIERIITDNGVQYGAELISGSERIRITMQGFHSQYVLDSLLENGWKLVSLPYGFEKEGCTLESLETVELSALNLTEEEKAEMFDMSCSERYSSADLKSKLSVSDLNRYRFRNPNPLIKTREELETFLRGFSKFKSMALDLTDPRLYMPLNSFVARAALYTVEEYYDAKNSAIRTIIERRRNLVKNEYLKIVDLFKQLGLQENFTGKDFLDMYFSWGVCGLRFEEYERSTENMQVDIETFSKTRNRNNSKGKVREQKLSYLMASGEFYKSPSIRGGNWRPIHGENKIHSIIDKNIAPYGDNYIYPLMLESEITEDVTHILGEGFEVYFNKYTLVTIRKGYSAEKVENSVTLSVRDKSGNKYTLDELVSGSEAEQQAFDRAYTNSMLLAMRDAVTVKTAQCSYLLIQRIGGSIVSAINKMSQFEDIIEDITINRIDSNTDVDPTTYDEDTKRTLGKLTIHEFVSRCKLYLRGNLPEEDIYYKDIELFVSEIMTGERNIDNIDSGEISDSNFNLSEYRNFIQVAVTYMGYTLSEVWNLLKDVSIEMNCVTFEKNGLRMLMPIKLNNNKQQGYINDLVAYQLECAKDAGALIYVNTAVPEARTQYGTKGRHVAVSGYIIDIAENDFIYDDEGNRKQGPGMRNRRTLQPVFNSLDNFIDEVLQEVRTRYVEGESEDERDIRMLMSDRYSKGRNVERARMIFELGMFDKAKSSKDTGNVIFEPENAKNLGVLVRNCWQTLCDTTVMISDNFVNGDGRYTAFCVNAIITPYRVIPKRGYEIEERPFFAEWYSTGGSGAVYDILRNKGVIPEKYNGKEVSYDKYKYPTMDKYRTLSNSPDSLEYYMKVVNDTIKQCNESGVAFKNPPHPFEMCYPALVGEDCFKTFPQTEGNNKNYIEEGILRDGIKQVPVITQQIMEERFQDVRELFDTENKYLIEDTKGFEPFTCLDPEDYYVFNNYKELCSIDEIPGEIPVIKVISKHGAVFPELGLVSEKKIEELYNSGKYKILRLAADRYLMETMEKELFEVRV